MTQQLTRPPTKCPVYDFFNSIWQISTSSFYFDGHWGLIAQALHLLCSVFPDLVPSIAIVCLTELIDCLTMAFLAQLEGSSEDSKVLDRSLSIIIELNKRGTKLEDGRCSKVSIHWPSSPLLTSPRQSLV